jgi:hypothetical protein
VLSARRKLEVGLLAIPLLLIELLVIADATLSDAFRLRESLITGATSAQTLFDNFNLQESLSTAIASATQTVITITQTVTAWFTVTSNTLQGNPFIVTDTPLNAVVSQIIVPAAIVIVVMLSAFILKIQYFAVVATLGVFALLGLSYIGILPNFFPFIIIIFLGGGVVKVVGEVFK